VAKWTLVGVAAQPPWVCVTHMGTAYCTVSLICVSHREAIAPQNYNKSYFTAGACTACVGDYNVHRETSKATSGQDRYTILF